MLFIFPKRKIVLDCFTTSEIILQTAPIARAVKHMPEWWKKLPNFYVNPDSFFPSSTMRSCVGMVDYYTNSIAIPLWSDLAVRFDSNGIFYWQFSDLNSKASVHDPKQSTNFLTNHQHLKLESPWAFKAKEHIKWVWSQPTYSFNKDIANIKVLPGILDFCPQIRPNVNLMFPISLNTQFILPQGQALVHLTPMSDRKIKIVRHLISDEEFKGILNQQQCITFTNKLKTFIKKRQQFLDCPYHKGK